MWLAKLCPIFKFRTVLKSWDHSEFKYAKHFFLNHYLEVASLIWSFALFCIIPKEGITVSAVLTSAALSHLWLANSLKKAPIVMLSIIGPAALQPIQWLWVLLKIMISLKRCGYYNRAALIRERKLIQPIWYPLMPLT